MTSLEHLLWAVLPYLVVLVLVGGTVWRYRYDRFGWTTRSSQLHESRLLRLASPLFHFGLLVVIIGHVIGLVIPKSWTEAVGVSQGFYHVNALVLGMIAGAATLAGIALLIYRRRVNGPVFSATTVNDKAMYLVLVLAIVTGMATTVLSAGADLTGGHGHDYRETVSLWFRSLFTLDPDVTAMSAATPAFKIHVLFGLTLFTLFPFTRLVHAFTAPVGYLFRPYVVYRSRGHSTRSRTRPARRGWE
ncbi:respiratory nitrate reductase subunit gamma [Nocardiopsis sp. YSL2]|uniref:respiratory nitrate reductase subunit gamma n=1 Tax=Nocardiopsis sp. YSL2 TaxID=2939492 RepID=UPI0026F41F99|nr:respiratory nitrate reductase subunit gamma [Nocardiopsis sp. YSL2]